MIHFPSGGIMRETTDFASASTLNFCILIEPQISKELKLSQD